MTAVDPTLAFRDFQFLKLNYEKLLSNFALNCKVRHFIKGTGKNKRELTEEECLVGRCRLTVSKSVLKAPMVSAL